MVTSLLPSSISLDAMLLKSLDCHLHFHLLHRMYSYSLIVHLSIPTPYGLSLTLLYQRRHV